jgi:hypothetical protein
LCFESISGDDAAMRLAGAIGAFVFCWATAAHAAPVTVSFSGTVSDVQDLDGIGDGSVSLGSAASGSLSFDDSAAPGSVAGALTLHVGSYALSSLGPLSISVGDFAPADDPYTDVFQALGTNGDASFGLVLVDATRTALASTSLAGVPFTLSSWTSAEATLQLVTDAGEFDVVVALSSLPEPATWALALVTLAALAPRLRRAR